MDAPSFPEDVQRFVLASRWIFARTYASSWPHEYLLRTDENAPLFLKLARHVFEHGVEERFYRSRRRYFHIGGQVYWSMDRSAELSTLVNRCVETETYENRLRAGTLPGT